MLVFNSNELGIKIKKLWESMNRKQALDILTRLKPELATCFGVTRLALFGSTVRNEVTEDIDIVVAFDAPATSKNILEYNLFWKIS